MSKAAFDAKFGENFLDTVPNLPGIYRYLASDGSVIYVGKAKNLRRRLSNYRNASRKKIHRKMRTLVRQAHALLFEVVETERDALLREGELIRQLRPRYNVESAYEFLYPYVGVGFHDRRLLLCLTTQVEAYESLQLSWFGCFRSRPRVKLAFESLLALFQLIGHQELARRLPEHPRIKGSRLVGFRQLPVDLSSRISTFLGGSDAQFLSLLATRLLEKPRATRDPQLTQEHLLALRQFYQMDAVPLRDALSAVDLDKTVVPQTQRDALFIEARFASSRSARV